MQVSCTYLLEGKVENVSKYNKYAHTHTRARAHTHTHTLNTLLIIVMFIEYSKKMKIIKLCHKRLR